MAEFRQRATGAPRIITALQAPSPYARTRDIMSERFYSERFDTPTGWMLLVTDAEQRLRAAEWEDKSHRLERSLRLHYGENGFQLQPLRGSSPARLALEAYFEGELTAIEAIRTQTRGTDFQRGVWAALREIPVGSTVSYGQLAKRIGQIGRAHV